MIRVAEFFRRVPRHAVTVKSTDTVGFLARQLQRHRVGVAVVSDTARSIDGVVSERDIAYTLADRRGELHLLPVSAIMSRSVVTCAPDDSLLHVMDLMSTHHIRHVPVKDAGALAGVVSMRDIFMFRLDEIERKINFASLFADQ